jgi:hypothetical protein
VREVTAERSLACLPHLLETWAMMHFSNKNEDEDEIVDAAADALARLRAHGPDGPAFISDPPSAWCDWTDELPEGQTAREIIDVFEVRIDGATHG